MLNNHAEKRNIRMTLSANTMMHFPKDGKTCKAAHLLLNLPIVIEEFPLLKKSQVHIHGTSDKLKVIK